MKPVLLMVHVSLVPGKSLGFLSWLQIRDLENWQSTAREESTVVCCPKMITLRVEKEGKFQDLANPVAKGTALRLIVNKRTYEQVIPPQLIAQRPDWQQMRIECNGSFYSWRAGVVKPRFMYPWNLNLALRCGKTAYSCVQVEATPLVSYEPWNVTIINLHIKSLIHPNSGL